MQTRPSSRDRIARHRTAQRERGLRAVTLWLPDVNNPAYQERLADECRRLSDFTADQKQMADAFSRNVGRVPGWR
jgi:hypothetical protein